MSAKIQTSLSLDAEKFAAAKQILARQGLNFSEAVNLFASQVVARQGLPFEVELPNEETQAAMRDVRNQANLETVSMEQLRREMGGA